MSPVLVSRGSRLFIASIYGAVGLIAARTVRLYVFHRAPLRLLRISGISKFDPLTAVWKTRFVFLKPLRGSDWNKIRAGDFPNGALVSYGWYGKSFYSLDFGWLGT